MAKPSKSKTITVVKPLKPEVIALAANSAKKIADANYRLGMEHNTWIGIVGREIKSVKDSMDSHHHFEEWVMEIFGRTIRHANEIIMALAMQDMFVEKGVKNLPSSMSHYRELARFGSNEIALERWVGFQKTGIKITQENIKNFVGQSLIESTKKPKGSNGMRVPEEVDVASIKDAPVDLRRIGVEREESEPNEARGLVVSVPKAEIESVKQELEESSQINPPTTNDDAPTVDAAKESVFASSISADAEILVSKGEFLAFQKWSNDPITIDANFSEAVSIETRILNLLHGASLEEIRSIHIWLALKSGMDQTYAIAKECFGEPAAGTNIDATESSTPAVADAAVEAKNFYGVFNTEGRAVVYKTIVKLWDKDDEVKKSKSPKRTIQPTLEECIAHCKERGDVVDGVAFYAYCESQGWKKANGQPITNWKQAVITWEGFEKKRNPEKFAPKPVEKAVETGPIPDALPNPNMGMRPDRLAKMKALKPFVSMEG